MKKLEDFQREMIIDRRDIVSKTRAWTEWTLNAAGWALWIFLVRHLVLLAIWYVAYRFFKYHMFTLEGIENTEFFGIGAGAAMIIFLSMIVWSRYNAWRFGGLDRRKSRGEARIEDIARYYKISPEDTARVHQSRLIEAHFDKHEKVRLKLDEGEEIEILYAPLDQAKHRQGMKSPQITSFENRKNLTRGTPCEKPGGLSGFSWPFVKMIHSLAEHDIKTALHCLRVSNLSINIAKKMGIEDELFLDSLKTAAALHDIGKIAVDSNLLNKATPLTESEFESIKKHVLFDAEAHFKVTLPEMVKQVIRQHHERENGSGYPDSLTSDHICLPAKICAVADSYDAMTSLRRYSESKSPSAALREIKGNAGNIYCKKTVEAFMRAIEHTQQNCKTGQRR